MNHRRRRIVLISLGAFVTLFAALALALDGAGLLNHHRSYLAFRVMAFVILLISLFLVIRWRTSLGLGTAVMFLAVVGVSAAILCALEKIPTSERKEFYLEYLYLRQEGTLLPSELAAMCSHGARWKQVDPSTVRIWRTDGPNTCDVIVVTLEDQTGEIRDVKFLGD